MSWLRRSVTENAEMLAVGHASHRHDGRGNLVFLAAVAVDVFSKPREAETFRSHAGDSNDHHGLAGRDVGRGHRSGLVAQRTTSDIEQLFGHPELIAPALAVAGALAVLRLAGTPPWLLRKIQCCRSTGIAN